MRPQEQKRYCFVFQSRQLQWSSLEIGQGAPCQQAENMNMAGFAEQVCGLLSGLTFGDQVDVAQPSSLFKVINIAIMVCLKQAFTITNEM